MHNHNRSPSQGSPFDDKCSLFICVGQCLCYNLEPFSFWSGLFPETNIRGALKSCGVDIYNNSGQLSSHIFPNCSRCSSLLLWFAVLSGQAPISCSVPSHRLWLTSQSLLL
ncbi:hypothetical protein GmHk_06G015612 [Glycine max]|nr:hypothetical protein GmHk_06G015612 [Glycine max]KAH1245224.1 hypothetical protein GmHk_06G015612 [Glycine max]